MVFVRLQKKENCLCKFSWLSKWEMADYISIFSFDSYGIFVQFIYLLVHEEKDRKRGMHLSKTIRNDILDLRKSKH